MKIKLGDRIYYIASLSKPISTAFVLDECVLELAEIYNRILLKETAADSKLLKMLLTKD